MCSLSLSLSVRNDSLVLFDFYRNDDESGKRGEIFVCSALAFYPTVVRIKIRVGIYTDGNERLIQAAEWGILCIG